MKKQYLVLGLGKFGSSIARTLINDNCEVLAIDKDANIVEYESQFIENVVQADITNEVVLKALDVGSFDVGVVAVGYDLEASILATLLLKEMGVGYVVAKAKNQIHANLLKKIGADKIISPEEEMGVRIAKKIINTNLIDIIDISDNYNIVELSAPDSWINKSLNELNVRNKFKINILEIKNNEEVFTSPSSDYVFKPGDVMVALCTKGAEIGIN